MNVESGTRHEEELQIVVRELFIAALISARVFFYHYAFFD